MLIVTDQLFSNILIQFIKNP